MELTRASNEESILHHRGEPLGFPSPLYIPRLGKRIYWNQDQKSRRKRLLAAALLLRHGPLALNFSSSLALAEVN